MTVATDLLADVVIANPAAGRVFERHHLDYCGGGQRSVADACAEAGINEDEVLVGLQALGNPESATDATSNICALIGEIVGTHHTFLRRELPRLAELMQEVVAAHGDLHPEVRDIDVTLAVVRNDLLPHLAKEEQILFPLVIQLLGVVEPTEFHCGAITNPIRVMCAEHDRVGGLLATLRHQTDDFTPPDDACPTWYALYAGLADLDTDTREHVHLENNVLFPRILELNRALVS